MAATKTKTKTSADECKCPSFDMRIVPKMDTFGKKVSIFEY